ncbi:hypothetical protein [Mucilaginibacter terrigena]|nr:hypothetical protein [Mucilaginibacter terrigena]
MTDNVEAGIYIGLNIETMTKAETGCIIHRHTAGFKNRVAPM